MQAKCLSELVSESVSVAADKSRSDSPLSDWFTYLTLLGWLGVRFFIPRPPPLLCALTRCS